MSSEIEKVFFQISIKEEDRDAIRILWHDDSWEEKGKAVPFKTQEFTRVAFGLVSSSAQINPLVKFFLDQCNTPFKQETSKWNVDNIIIRES